MLALENFENMHNLGPFCYIFLAHKVILLKATVTCKNSLLKTCSLQAEFLWNFMYTMLLNPFYSFGTCFIAVSYLAFSSIYLNCNDTNQLLFQLSKIKKK